jgi:Prokaryotic Cytochrome C oxidase subunit IV
VKTRSTRVRLLLSVITLVSAWLGSGGRFRDALSALLTAGVLTIAVVKARFVIRDFMDVRAAPAWLRYGTDGWLAVLLAVFLILYPH